MNSRGVTATTDENGNYSLANLPAGATNVSGSATGFTSGSVAVTVVAGSTVTAPVMTLTSNSGTVTGTVKNSSGAGIAGASVGYGGGTASTDATGTYTLNGVPYGTVQLVASASGFQSVTQNVTITGGATAIANFTLASAPAGGIVTGKVTNASTGAILAGATVSWSGGTTASNASGVYTLTNVTAGNQSITGVANGYLPRTIPAAITAGGTTTLNIPLATAGHITVKVTNSTNAAVPAASVTIKGGAVPTTVTGATSTAGTFVTGWIPVGSYTITVAKTGHTTKSKTATVSTGATTTVTFTAF